MTYCSSLCTEDCQQNFLINGLGLTAWDGWIQSESESRSEESQRSDKNLDPRIEYPGFDCLQTGAAPAIHSFGAGVAQVELGKIRGGGASGTSQ